MNFFGSHNSNPLRWHRRGPKDAGQAWKWCLELSVTFFARVIWFFARKGQSLPVSPGTVQSGTAQAHDGWAGPALAASWWGEGRYLSSIVSMLFSSKATYKDLIDHLCKTVPFFYTTSQTEELNFWLLKIIISYSPRFQDSHYNFPYYLCDCISLS